MKVSILFRIFKSEFLEIFGFKMTEVTNVKVLNFQDANVPIFRNSTPSFFDKYLAVGLVTTYFYGFTWRAGGGGLWPAGSMLDASAGVCDSNLKVQLMQTIRPRTL